MLVPHRTKMTIMPHQTEIMIMPYQTEILFMSHQAEIMYNTFSNYIYHMEDHTTILCKNKCFLFVCFFQIIPFQGEFRVCN